ncbi:MAG: hypothetical protein JO034_29415, partial [Singulisphaera sp.]|nr:hypothetical protein [Singulisphaera sp.]
IRAAVERREELCGGELPLRDGLQHELAGQQELGVLDPGQPQRGAQVDRPLVRVEDRPRPAPIRAPTSARRGPGPARGAGGPGGWVRTNTAGPRAMIRVNNRLESRTGPPYPSFLNFSPPASSD